MSVPVCSLHQAIAQEAEKKTVWNDLLEPVSLCAQSNVQALSLSKVLVPILKSDPALNTEYNGVVGGLVNVIKDTTALCHATTTLIGQRGAVEVTADEYPDFLNQSMMLNTQLSQLQVQVEACSPIIEKGA